MPNKETPKQLNDYARWSSLSFQMIGVILALVFLGHYLDSYFQFTQPFLTITGSVLGAGLAFYLLIREAIRK
jgi:F0F1-type ATP synthase assembly protein I